jgi:hypothetical protein
VNLLESSFNNEFDLRLLLGVLHDRVDLVEGEAAQERLVPLDYLITGLQSTHRVRYGVLLNAHNVRARLPGERIRVAAHHFEAERRGALGCRSEGGGISASAVVYGGRGGRGRRRSSEYHVSYHLFTVQRQLPIRGLVYIYKFK